MSRVAKKLARDRICDAERRVVSAAESYIGCGPSGAFLEDWRSELVAAVRNLHQARAVHKALEKNAPKRSRKDSLTEQYDALVCADPSGREP